MKKLNQYIIEKFKISKNISSFDEEDFKKVIDRYKLGPSTSFVKELKIWCEKFNILDIDIYGWPGINKLMDVEDSYIEDDKERNRLSNILIKNGTKIEGLKYDDTKDKNFYYTDSLFCMLSKDNTFGIVAKNKK